MQVEAAGVYKGCQKDVKNCKKVVKTSTIKSAQKDKYQ